MPADARGAGSGKVPVKVWSPQCTRTARQVETAAAPVSERHSAGATCFQGFTPRSMPELWAEAAPRGLPWPTCDGERVRRASQRPCARHGVSQRGPGPPSARTPGGRLVSPEGLTRTVRPPEAPAGALPPSLVCTAGLHACLSRAPTAPARVRTRVTHTSPPCRLCPGQSCTELPGPPRAGGRGWEGMPGAPPSTAAPPCALLSAASFPPLWSGHRP